MSIMEQGEDFPAVLVDQQNVRAYPAPYGINAAHLLGYLSPITEDELDGAEERGDTSVHGASVVGRAGLEKQYDKYLRGYPGYKRGRRRLDGPRARHHRRDRGPGRRHAGHLASTPGSRPWSSSSSSRPSRPPGRPTTT